MFLFELFLDSCLQIILDPLKAVALLKVLLFFSSVSDNDQSLNEDSAMPPGPVQIVQPESNIKVTKLLRTSSASSYRF